MDFFGGLGRRFSIVVGLAGAVCLLWSWQLDARADGSNVAQSLSGVFDRLGTLTNSVDQGGGYGAQPNAAEVPFLGADPTQGLPGVFAALNALDTGFDGFNPADDLKVQVITDKIESVDSSLGAADQITNIEYCDGACTNASDVVEVTSIDFRVTISGGTDPSDPPEVDFEDLGLPSINFLTDGGKLAVKLNWTVTIDVRVDGSGVHLVPIDGTPELLFGAEISLPMNAFEVDLGLLQVQATPERQPTFKGGITVDLQPGGGLAFGFLPGSGFDARWRLETTDAIVSPLKGVRAYLDIVWTMPAAGVDASGLTIKFDDLTIDAGQFVGHEIEEAVGFVRELIHPIRTVTSPLLEPIPGLSDLAEELGQGEVSLLRISELQGGDPQFRDILQKIRAIDDAIALFDASGELHLGSFTLTGPAALQANGAITPNLESILNQCESCRSVVNAFLRVANGGETLGQGGFKFDFPVLNNPSSLAGLLLGRDVDLFTFDTGRLGPDKHFTIPLASVFIFSVDIKVDFTATIRLVGGVDTRGIIDALQGGGAADIVNGLYLRAPDDGPMVRFEGKALLAASALGGIASIGGGPDLHVDLNVPPGLPQGKLRPALVQGGLGGLGCTLLSGDGRADFSVLLEAEFDYGIDSHTEVLARHTFFNREDLCQPAAAAGDVAELAGGQLTIRTASQRSVPGEQPDQVKVFMRHDAAGNPTRVVVEVNNNRRAEFDAALVDLVVYNSENDPRPVLLRVVSNDGKPFEEFVDVRTGSGNDDLNIDTSSPAKVFANGGHDAIVVTGGGTSLLAGGEGNDRMTGGPSSDLIGGGPGDDTINGAGGSDQLFGGPGSDGLFDSSPEFNCLAGQEGDDRLVSGPGADDLQGDEAPFAIIFFACAAPDPGPDPENVGEAGGGADHILTGGGADKVIGGDGNDRVSIYDNAPAGGADNPIYDAGIRVDGNGGADTITTGDGPDVVHGGPGNDTVNAGEGQDTVHGGLGEDDLTAGGGIDAVYGDNGVDTCEVAAPNVPAEADTQGAKDTVNGGDGNDSIALEAGDDTANGGRGDDTICGHAGVDTIDGGEDGDDVLGGTGNDKLHGGGGGDDVHGNDGADTLDGDDGDDRIVGGSWNDTTADDGVLGDGFGDHAHGGAGHDVIAGDNASITPSAVVTLLAETSIGQPDLLYGDAGHDALYGEHLADDLYGGEGDDHVEGGDDADDLYGEAGQDDLIGGTGKASVPDTSDNLVGGDGHDVIAGDNAAISRFGAFGAWTTDDLVDRAGTDNDVLGVVRRRVVLFDLATATAPTAGDGFGGAENIDGGAGHDLIYGQVGDDELRGGPLDDHLEGGAGVDAIYGQAGQDDLVGGTGRTVSDDPNSAADGRLDGAETLFGDDDPNLRPLSGIDDFDVVLGDNGTVLRGNPWVLNTFNASINRTVHLSDVGTATTPAAAGTGGRDTIRGQAADDVLYGQNLADDIEGGDGDDYMEGNEGSDAIRGLNGNDDIIGGTGRINGDPATGTNGRLEGTETLSGGPGFDVMAGDNAIIRRVLTPAGAWLANTFNGGVQHERVQLLDMASLTNPNVPATVFGNDTLDGNEDDDVMYGQGGDDPMRGNDGDDYMEGNAGADVMQGDANQDDMIGGTGRVNQDPPTGGNGRFDGNDLMFGADAAAGAGGDGGDDYDAMIGDNAVIERPLTPLPAGDWRVNTFNDGVERTITMLDLELASAAAADARVRGADTMFGNGDDDLIRGQGGNDTMHGNDGDDDMEGNAAVDRMFGDAHQDDMLGGSRVAGRRDAGDFLYGGADHDTVLGDNALLVRPLTPLPAGDWQVQDYGHVFNDAVTTVDQHRVIRTTTNLDTAIGLTSGSDVVHGQEGDDDLFGQLDDTGDTNGGSGPVPVTENCDLGPLVMPNDPYFTGEPTGAFTIAGDLVCGGVGEDAILGDQGTVTSFVEHGSETVLTHNGAPFITERSRVESSLARKVVLQGIAVGGADVLLGDEPANRTADGIVRAGLGAHDSIHGGAGADTIHGLQGDDFLFGDDGSDAIWGGDHDDHVWGGYEGDFVDVLPRTTETAGTLVDDPITWFFFGPDDPDTIDNPATEAREGYDGYRGFEIVYGGWGQDAMQANEGDNGPVRGDRLVDWAGTYNAYYLCPATYGEFVSTRQQSPSLQSYLQGQAEADGATDVLGGPRATDSGFDELALVYSKDIRQNANPNHPDTPAHFTCR